MKSDLAVFEGLEAGQRETYARDLTLPERAAIGVTTLGGLVFVLCTIAPEFARSLGWGGFLAVFGLTGAGAVAWITLTYRGTQPGIRHDGVFFEATKRRSAFTYVVTVLLCSLYCSLWWWRDYAPASLQHLDPLAGGIAIVDPLARVLTGGPADGWFFYGFLYTFAVAVMGVRMFWKYRHNRYHIARTISVIWWQAAFGFTVPGLLKMAGEKDFYFTYFWPLKPDYLLPWEVDHMITATSLGRAMVLWGAGMTFVAVPVLTYLYGKRWYCSWVCGCGALAETFGDPWRQMSDKSERAWRFERISIHSVLALITLITVGAWVHEALGRPWLSDGGSGLFWKWYGFFIVAGFAGVVGTGFYPVLGSRVWCRYGCPQAAILGILQRFLSRFRITTNGGQCISCGNCSTFCEMGIDVRAYAQRGENIVRASCVGCGVCAAVCPRGVLKLENGAYSDRFDGADEPLAEVLRAIGVRSRS
ncbi:MAG: 4Fe-4S binding protein [Myxococcota bacterium]